MGSLHIHCRLRFYVGNFSYIFRSAFIFIRRGSLTDPVLASSFYLLFFFFFYLGSFSYTSHAGFIFIGGVSLTHPVLASFLSGEFLLHIPCWLRFYLFFFLFFIWGVSLTHPMLDLLLHIPSSLRFFLLFLGSFSSTSCWVHFYRGSFSYTSRAGFIFILGVSLTHPVLDFFFNLWSFSYTSHIGFTFLW